MLPYKFDFLLICCLFLHGGLADIIDHVTSDNMAVLQQIEELKNDRRKDRQIISSMEAQITSIRDSCRTLLEEKDELKNRIKMLESLHNSESFDIEDGVPRSRREVSNGHFNNSFPSLVAFSAYLGHTIDNLVDDSTIKFDQVVTNVGNGYNPKTGVFTCPISGTYVFTWSVGMFHPGYIYTYLIKNGDSVSFANTSDDDYSSMTSQTSVLALNYGDVITVKVVSHSATPGLWYGRTSFNGFILQ